jgi:tRNA threonylcarbamoyladenosine dehydratase
MTTSASPFTSAGPSVSALDATGYYRELTTRNAGVISAADQRVLSEATVLVAGCGSIGGSAVEPLARLGVQNFLLADPGTYELNNLNRQNATSADIDRNKAEVAAERVLAVNPHANVRVFPKGVNADSVAELTDSPQVVVDGVDVTTMEGLRAKFLLHQYVMQRKLPLVTGWDMAGAQYVRYYDYRRLTRVFDGQLTEQDLDGMGVWQLLQKLIPVRYVPTEMLTVVRENLSNPDFSFPQIVYSAALFGAITSHAVARLLCGEQIREHIYVDLHQQAKGPAARIKTRLRWPAEAVSVLRSVRALGSS